MSELEDTTPPRLHTYDFTVVVKYRYTLDDELLDRLHRAGCNDCTPSWNRGYLVLMFSRQALSKESAVLSAIEDLEHKVGLDPRRFLIF